MLKTKSEISLILDKIVNIYPNAKTELNYKTPFQFIIAVILSAQTTDRQVNKVTNNFFKIVKNAEDITKLSLLEIEQNLKSINFYKNKSKFIKLCWEKLVFEFNSKIPNNLQMLMTFPWIWIKSAKVILSNLYNLPYVWVDTHIHRICNRIGIIKTKKPEDTDKKIEEIFSQKQKMNIHNSLVLFWRYICKAKNPKCNECIINKYCNYLKKL